ncbi:RICIN domain-containing protein [Streptomyces cinnamoneus]|uniref:RICIN domain-containing protein n=1 Tax=Streptomyces cinnamoneus TaxID=53446 RepID=UPI0033DA1377
MFRNANSDKCLEIRGGSRANGARANQWECNYSSSQQWNVSFVGPEMVEMTVLSSGKCLEIWGDDPNDFAPANQYTCNGSATQRWYWYADPINGRSYFKNANSGKSLEIIYWGKGDGDFAVQYTYFGQANQQWNARQL